MPRIGIIGGTGVYNTEKFELIKEVYPDTPYGKPSAPIVIGKINGVEVAFLHRHGTTIKYPPSFVPYKANIYALKQLGVEMIVSPCAVGSLKENYRPGDLVIVDQFIDWTKGREYTYFDKDIVHIAIPDPMCPQMAKVMERSARILDIPYHNGGTYICVEGNRFSTKAEGMLFRIFADVIGMTVVPECQLAREMGMCYCSIATVTDYDAWKEETVTYQMVIDCMKKNLQNVSNILDIALPVLDTLPKCKCKQAAIDAGAIKE